MSPVQIILLLKAILALLWPVTCLAASITLRATVGEITPEVAAIVLAISTLAGVTSLVITFDRELKAGGSIPRPWLFIAVHMFGSWLAGIMAFFICESQNVSDWSELIVISVFAFVGSRAIEKVVDLYMNRILPNSGKTS